MNAFGVINESALSKLGTAQIRPVILRDDGGQEATVTIVIGEAPYWQQRGSCG